MEPKEWTPGDRMESGEGQLLFKGLHFQRLPGKVAAWSSLKDMAISCKLRRGFDLI